MKKFLSVLVAVLVLVTAVISVMATDVSVQSVDERTRQQFLMESEEQREAVAAHEVLYNSFLVEGSVEENFPDNYGGDYIKDGILHINIVDLPAQDITYYYKLLADYLDYIRFEDVDYSLASLLNASETISDALMDDGIQVTSYSVMEPTNSVRVGVSSDSVSQADVCAMNSAQPYASESNSIPVEFVVEEMASPSTELMGGSRLDGYTLGVCGYYRGKPAFAMCGHGLSDGESVLYQSNKKSIGTVAVRRYDEGQAGDYAIIPISGSSFTITNKVGNPNNENEQFAITTSISRAATGTKVLRYGKYSGITEGTVSSAYCDVTYKNNDKTTTYVTNLVKVDLKYGEAISGDSGGPVFTATGSFCGVHSGSDETGKVTTYFSPTQYLSTSSFSCAVG